MGRRVVAVVGMSLVLGVGCAPDPDDSRRGATVAGDPGDPASPVTAADSGDDSGNGIVVEVTTLDNTFRPDQITIEAGTAVLFTNVGRNEHNVIPEPDSIQGWGVSDIDFPPGAKYTHVFDVAGEYRYVCTIHGVNGKGMVGTIIVTG